MGNPDCLQECAVLALNLAICLRPQRCCANVLDVVCVHEQSKLLRHKLQTIVSGDCHRQAVCCEHVFKRIDYTYRCSRLENRNLKISAVVVPLLEWNHHLAADPADRLQDPPGDRLEISFELWALRCRWLSNYLTLVIRPDAFFPVPVHPWPPHPSPSDRLEISFELWALWCR